MSNESSPPITDEVSKAFIESVKSTSGIEGASGIKRLLQAIRDNQVSNEELDTIINNLNTSNEQRKDYRFVFYDPKPSTNVPVQQSSPNTSHERSVETETPNEVITDEYYTDEAYKSRLESSEVLDQNYPRAILSMLGGNDKLINQVKDDQTYPSYTIAKTILSMFYLINGNVLLKIKRSKKRNKLYGVVCSSMMYQCSICSKGLFKLISQNDTTEHSIKLFEKFHQCEISDILMTLTSLDKRKNYMKRKRTEMETDEIDQQDLISKFNTMDQNMNDFKSLIHLQAQRPYLKHIIPYMIKFMKIINADDHTNLLLETTKTLLQMMGMISNSTLENLQKIDANYTKEYIIQRFRPQVKKILSMKDPKDV